jgi:hypothetical protein
MARHLGLVLPRSMGTFMHTTPRLIGLAAVFVLATLNPTVTAQQRPTSVSDQQLSDLVGRVETGVTAFRASVNRDSSGARGQDRSDLDRSLVDLQQAAERLRQGRQSRRGDGSRGVADLLERASTVDRLVTNSSLNAAAARDWRGVRRNLDELARAHGLASEWGADRGAGRDQRREGRDRLTGTYQLDASRGDESERAVQQATRQLRPNQRQAAEKRLMNRLQAPETMAIDRKGASVTMASSRGRQVTFEADGQVRREEGPAGRSISTRAVLTGDQLAVTTTGNRRSDFSVTLEPTDDGRSLRVTRRIQDETLRQPVTVVSYYRKTSDEANWDIDAARPGRSSGRNPAAADFGVPDGTRLVGTLDSPLTTRTSNAEDRFSITTRSPSQFEGAVIEGTISSVNASGRVNGRAEMALNFERIRLRNGRTHDFAAVIETVRTVDGDTIAVNEEGTVADGSQTQKTVQRGAIGAALGAIIGAIGGGGQGAAIGAAIGAGGGAGTVIAQGRDQLELARNTEFTIISGARGSEPVARER